MTPEGGRTWGYWTQLKLAMLRDYLTQFVVASQAQSERIYLDAFAGEGHGRDRLTGAEFRGSARIALDVGGGTGFTRFRYFELGPKASELESAHVPTIRTATSRSTRVTATTRFRRPFPS